MIRLWSVADGKVLREFEANQSGVAAVAFAADGGVLASGGPDGRVRFWGVRSGRLRGELTGHTGPVRCLTFGVGGWVLASGGQDCTLRLWDRGLLKELKVHSGHSGAINALAFSPDGRTIATGSEDQTVRLWDTVSGDVIARMAKHDGRVEAIAFAPDGKTLASGGWDRTVWLWEIPTGRPLRMLSGHSGGVRAVAFTPNGRELVTGGGKALRTWEVETGRALRLFPQASGAVLAADLSPDGATLATSAADGLIRFWSLSEGHETGQWEGHRGPVVALAYSPDGLALASASSGVSIADPKPAELVPTPDEPSSATAARTPAELWDDLAGPLRQALAATRTLQLDDDTTLALMRERLRPVRFDAKTVTRWVNDLLGSNEAARTDAVDALVNLGELAEKPLAETATTLSAGSSRDRIEEVRALIRANSPSPQTLRGLRAIELLARIGTHEAATLLGRLAAGATESTVTTAAKAAFARLKAKGKEA